MNPPPQKACTSSQASPLRRCVNIPAGITGTIPSHFGIMTYESILQEEYFVPIVLIPRSKQKTHPKRPDVNFYIRPSVDSPLHYKNKCVRIALLSGKTGAIPVRARRRKADFICHSHLRPQCRNKPLEHSEKAEWQHIPSRNIRQPIFPAAAPA